MEIRLEDFNKSCRCCLAMVDALKPMFGAGLNVMFTKVMNLQITQSDGYPQQICFRCVLKLSSTYTFHTMVMKNHNTLEEILKRAEKNGKPNVDSCDQRKELKTEKDRNNMDIEINTSDTNYRIPDKIPCDEDFNSISKKDMHTKRISKISESKQSEASDQEDDYQCSQCYYTTKDQAKFEIHLQTHLSGFKNISQANIDTCTHLCNLCGAKFRWRTSLHKHLRQHRGRHRCQVCHKLFGEASSLSVHMVCHSSNQKPYQCSICGRSFTQQSSLRKHAQTHDARAQLNCNDCGKNFLHKNSLLRHRENAHSTTECPPCGKTFTGKKLLDAHMKLHKKDMDRLKTEILTENTDTDNLNIQTVTVEFLCLICTQKFQSKESLEEHICVADKKT